MLPFQQAFQFGIAAATVTALAACSGGTEASTAEEAGGHVHHAKFGGTLVELGDHFAAFEVTSDFETGEIALYTWDAHVEGAERSSTEAPTLTVNVHGMDPFELVLAPRVSETSGEKAGDSSKFTAQHDSLKGLDHFEATLAELTLKGKSFTDVDFMHPSDAHDHDHDGEEHGDGEDHDEDHDDHEGHDHDGDEHSDSGNKEG